MTMRAGWMIAAALVVGGGAGLWAAEPDAAKGGGPRDVAAIAEGMPAIKREGDVVRLPLTSEGALAWRPIREGVRVEGAGTDAAKSGSVATGEIASAAGALKVSYKRTRGQAAGAALVIRPDTLTGLQHIELKVKSVRAQRLSVCLKDRAGVVWTFPTVSLSGDEAVDRTLKVAEIEPDAYQNKGKVEAKFDPATVVMITVIDIGGYMSVTEPDFAWSIETMKGVCK